MRAKKYTSLLLAAVMVISMVGCGKKEVSQENTTSNISSSDSEENTQAEEVRYEFDENGELHIYATEEQVSEMKIKIVLTKDNWNEYFGDYDYTEHVVEKNAFGDIEREYDVRKRGFGPKKEFFVCDKKDVAFKFDGIDLVAAYYFPGNDELDKVVYLAGSDKAKIYDKNGNCVEEYDVDIKDYYTVAYKTDEYQFEEHELIDVMGEITVVDLPLENYYEGHTIHWHQPGDSNECGMFLRKD